MIAKSFRHLGYMLRSFGLSWIVTFATILAVLYFMGPEAALVACILMVIEITFSFENAVMDAKIVSTLSPFWQKMFLTVGIMIAIFGMRVIFPIAIVALSSGIPWREVLSMALNDPEAYAHALESAHVTIAAFGGMFLLMLAMHFFFDGNRKHIWIPRIEEPLIRFSKGKPLMYVFVVIGILLLVWATPGNPHPTEVLIAGSVGIIVYTLMHGLAELFARRQALHKHQGKRAGIAGLIGFLYLEVQDASFSFDGVIGAFAVTDVVILIAAGLGVGAVWVRSLTVHMVRKGTLETYLFLEHGAQYTIVVLSATFITSIFMPVPEVIAGLAGIAFIASAVYSSIAYKNAHLAPRAVQ
jgi:uncharacterized protein